MIKRIKFLFLSLRLRKELNKKKSKIKIISKNKFSVGILLDSKYNLNDSFIENLAMSLELSKDRFDITVNTILIEDISLFGKLPESINKFLNRRFDLLFNLHYNNSLLSLLSVLSKANFRIGLIEADKKLNDLIINLSPLNSKLFIGECVKYINIIFKNKL